MNRIQLVLVCETKRQQIFHNIQVSPPIQHKNGQYGTKLNDDLERSRGVPFETEQIAH